MASDPRLEDTISAWLEETAPERLPGRVLDATFERTRRSGQQRGWRPLERGGLMPRLVPVLGAAGAAAAVVIAAVVALGVIPPSGPGTSPTAPPTPVASSPLPTPRSSPVAGSSRFTSAVHGISIDHPSAWQARPATEPWALDPVAFAASGVDVIYDPQLQGDLYIGIVSAAVPATGSEPHDLTFGLLGPSRVCDGTNWGGQGDWGGGAGRWTVDGSRGWGGYCSEGPPDDRTAVQTNWYAFVQTATRRYLIYLHIGDQRKAPGYDEATFDALIGTIDLLP